MTTTLIQLIDPYIRSQNEQRPIGRELTPKTLIFYRECVQSYTKHLGRVPMIDDFAPERVNEFLAVLLNKGRSQYTVKNRRTGLRALLRFAIREGLIEANPDRLRRVHCDPLEIKGYSTADMQRLLVAASALTGKVRRTGIAKRVYFVSVVLTMWNIGCRIGDVAPIEVDKFDPRGRLWVYEHKTRKSRWHKLHGVTTEAITECLASDPTRQRIWAGFKTKFLHRALKRIITAAGLTGTSRYIRRGASSELDRLQPGMGWRFLNHSTPRVFEQHYRCADICEDESLSPPELSIT